MNPKVGQKCKTFGDALHSGRLFLFILFVVLSHYSDRICSFPRFSFSKTVTIAQKGFLHDKERMIFSDLINKKMTDRALTNAVGRLLIISFILFQIPIRPHKSRSNHLPNLQVCSHKKFL